MAPPEPPAPAAGLPPTTPVPSPAPAGPACPSAPGEPGPASAPAPKPRRRPDLNPFSLFFGPIFQKEVIVTGRRKATYFTRALYPLLLLAFASLFYFAALAAMPDTSGAMRLQQLQQLAPGLALVLAWCQFGFLGLVAPVLTASSICSERRARTLGALLTTPMSSAQIVFGKLASRLVILLILALFSAPLLLAVRVFGGLEAELILALTAVSLSTAVLTASLGLLLGTWQRRAATAAVMAVLIFLLLTIGPVTVIAIVANNTRWSPPAWLITGSALITMAGITASISGGNFGLDFTWMWVANTAVNLGMALLVCLFACATLRRIMLAEASGTPAPRKSKRRAATPPVSAVPAVPVAAPTQGLPDAAAPSAEASASDDASDEQTREGRTRVVGDQPVLWREVRQPAFGSRRLLVILALVVAAAFGLLYYYLPMSDYALHRIVVFVGLFVVCLHAAIAATGAVAGEREDQTWTVLLTTPLTAREILLGKLVGGLRRQWFTPAVVMAHLALAAALGWIYPPFLLHVALVLIGVAVMLTGTGLLLSLLLRASTTAAVVNIGFALSLWVGLPIVAGLTMELLSLTTTSFSNTVGDLVVTINPFALVGIASESATTDYAYIFRPSAYSFLEGSLTLAPFTMVVACLSALACSVGIGATLAAAALFPRASGRSS